MLFCQACSLALAACSLSLVTWSLVHQPAPVVEQGPNTFGPLSSTHYRRPANGTSSGRSGLGSSIYFLDLSWSSFTSRSVSSNAAAILSSTTFVYFKLSLSIIIPFYIHPILSLNHCQACCLKLGACSFLFLFSGSELPGHARSSFTTPASVNSLPPLNHINPALPPGLGTWQRWAKAAPPEVT